MFFQHLVSRVRGIFSLHLSLQQNRLSRVVKLEPDRRCVSACSFQPEPLSFACVRRPWQVYLSCPYQMKELRCKRHPAFLIVMHLISLQLALLARAHLRQLRVFMKKAITLSEQRRYWCAVSSLVFSGNMSSYSENLDVFRVSAPALFFRHIVHQHWWTACGTPSDNRPNFGLESGETFM